MYYQATVKIVLSHHLMIVFFIICQDSCQLSTNDEESVHVHLNRMSNNIIHVMLLVNSLVLFMRFMSCGTALLILCMRTVQFLLHGYTSRPKTKL